MSFMYSKTKTLFNLILTDQPNEDQPQFEMDI